MQNDRPKTTEELIAETLREGKAGTGADVVIQEILQDTLRRIRELDERYRQERGEIWGEALRSIRAAKRAGR